MAFLKSLVISLFYTAVILALITFIPGIPPDAAFSEYSIVPAKELPNNFALNEKLNSPEILFQGQIKGPEAFASFNGELYTGAHGGYVFKITEGQLVPVVKFGKECDGIWQESKCGRPLGLKFDKKGTLYVADAYYGIFKVDVKTGKYERLVDSKVPIEGKKPMIINSLDIASNGDIYWSDSCSDFHLEDGVYCMITNPSGRLIWYNAATKKNQVLVHDLGFANGIALSKDESSVMVLETATSRITKYNIKGAQAGKREIVTEGMPGLPDNIYPDNKSGYLISLVVHADSQHPILSQSLTSHPHIRRLAARLLMMLEAPFKCLQSHYPNLFTEKITHYLGGFESMMFLIPKIVAVLRINDNGEIIDAAYGTDGKISGVTSAYIFNGFLWLGSADAEYIARISLEQVFPDLVSNEQHKHIIKKSTRAMTEESPPKSTSQKKIVSTTPSPNMSKTRNINKKPSNK